MEYGPRRPGRLHDHVALDEIELYAEVLVAAAHADRRLAMEELDRVLGLITAPEPGRPLPDNSTTLRPGTPEPEPTPEHCASAPVRRARP